MRTVFVSASAADAARHGHPWVWQRGIVKGFDRSRPGEEIRLVADGPSSGRGGAAEPLAHGLADPGSPLAIRLWTRGDRPVDRALFERRTARACELRAGLFADGATTAYRVLHGEGDRVPGFVIDRYGEIAVLRLDGKAAEARAEELVDAAWPALERLGVRALVRRDRDEAEGRPGARELVVLRGAGPIPERVNVREHGVPFAVDLARGQKTGAFLDQRENRRRVGALARGRRVLNLFSYAGGFTLHAALGGATHVTSVDVAAAAHATAQESFRLAGVDPSKHAFASADVFAFLEAAKKRGETWDLVVSDPPSFAPSEKAVPRALAAYRSLHRACVEVLADGGIFCAASCSSHVDARAFASTLDDASLARDDLRVLETFGPPADHPTTPAWVEGRYLKFVVLA